MTNKTINGVPRELLRQQFEEKNEHRGWFVAGGRLEDTSPEGYIYEDFTTDMCWTCYFEAASSALLAAPDPVVEADGIGCPKVWATDGIEEPAAWQRKSKMHGNCWYPLSSDEVNDAVACGWEVRPLYSADQVAALQSTIAQLKAENERLQGLLKSSK